MYPLPLILAVLELLCEAIIFMKLDLCSTYNLILIINLNGKQLLWPLHYCVIPYGPVSASSKLLVQSFNLDLYNLYHWFIKNYSNLSVTIALWVVRQHPMLCTMGIQSLNPDSRTFLDNAPPLSPTSLPVNSDMSYHNKVKNAKVKNLHSILTVPLTFFLGSNLKSLSWTPELDQPLSAWPTQVQNCDNGLRSTQWMSLM